MFIHLKKNRFLLFLILFFLSRLAIATTWPIFLSPDKNFLKERGIIIPNSCPTGEGRIIPYALINIQRSLCKTFCPDNWYFIGSDDRTCHSLSSGFEFQRYKFIYNRDENGATLGTKIVALYGERVGGIEFSFIYTSPENEHWYCYEVDTSSHAITCANDI